MKKSIIATICFVVSLIAFKNSYSQSTSSYQPGSLLRIDFEGKHRFIDHRVVPVNRYQPGQALRVDFEGKHLVVDRRNVPVRRYIPGPALRVDIEGLHYFRRRTTK